MDHDEEVAGALSLLKEYFKSLPDTYKIKWYSSGFQKGRKAEKWINVHCEELEDLLEIRWVWTIVNPEEQVVGDMDFEDINPFDLMTRYDLKEMWSVHHINKLLTEWVQSLSLREDLEMEWDPVGEVSEELQMLEEKLQNEEFYNIGKDSTGKEIFVSSETMDFLLEQDPDDAASIIKHMKNMLKQSMDDEDEDDDEADFGVDIDFEGDFDFEDEDEDDDE